MVSPPWTVLGWLLVAIVVAGMVAAPLALIWAARVRRRAIERFEAHRAEMDRMGAQITSWENEGQGRARFRGRFRP